MKEKIRAHIDGLFEGAPQTKRVYELREELFANLLEKYGDLIAKGYSDCVAYISEDGISVAVASPEGGMQQADVAVIADIVLSQTQLELTQIRVVEV